MSCEGISLPPTVIGSVQLEMRLALQNFEWVESFARRNDGSLRDCFVSVKWWGDIGDGAYLKPAITGVPEHQWSLHTGDASHGPQSRHFPAGLLYFE
jgi:hypothetical protein